MAEIRRSAAFDKFMKGLKDTKARAKILVRIDRLGKGNPGDIEPVGQGVSEMRIHYGPGYRVYLKRRGDVTTLLTVGTKDSQESDIRTAKALASELED